MQVIPMTLRATLSPRKEELLWVGLELMAGTALYPLIEDTRASSIRHRTRAEHKITVRVWQIMCTVRSRQMQSKLLNYTTGQ